MIVDESGGGLQIQDMVVGGPAFNSQQLSSGDRLLAVDGLPVNPHTYHESLIGGDAPGTLVKLTVRSSSDHVKEVTIARTSTSGLLNKILLFEVFTKLKDDAFARRDKDTISNIDQGLELYCAILQDVDKAAAASIHPNLQFDCKQMLFSIRKHLARIPPTSSLFSPGLSTPDLAASKRSKEVLDRNEGDGKHDKHILSNGIRRGKPLLKSVDQRQGIASTPGRIALENLVQRMEESTRTFG